MISLGTAKVHVRLLVDALFCHGCIWPSAMGAAAFGNKTLTSHVSLSLPPMLSKEGSLLTS